MNIRQAMALEAMRNYSAGLVLLVGTHVFKGRAKVNLERTLHSGIEIENVRQVDGSRLILPFEDEDGQPRRASLINEATNYSADIPGSKVSWRTLALDFESDTAISIIRRIARTKSFDARVTNLAESLQDRFGLSYEHLQSIDARTVAVNCSYDGTAIGSASTTRRSRARDTRTSVPRTERPNLGGPSVIDHWAACRAALYVSTGIRIAEKTGIGLKYDVTLLGIAVEGQGYMGTTAWTQRFKEMMGDGRLRPSALRSPLVRAQLRQLRVQAGRTGGRGRPDRGDGARSTWCSAPSPRQRRRPSGNVLGADSLAEHCTDSWQMFHHRDEIGESIEERTKQMTPAEVIKLDGQDPGTGARPPRRGGRTTSDPARSEHDRPGGGVGRRRHDDRQLRWGRVRPRARHGRTGEHTEELLLEAGYSASTTSTRCPERR